MREILLVFSLVLAAVVMSACRSRSAPAPVTSLPATSASPTAATDIVHSLIWNIPSNLPIYGERESNSIRVAIFGMSVERPGFYFLPSGATVSNAVDAAGLKEFVGWKTYSGLARLKSDGSPEMITFPNRRKGLLMILDEGDQVYFGHEVC